MSDGAKTRGAGAIGWAAQMTRPVPAANSMRTQWKTRFNCACAFCTQALSAARPLAVVRRIACKK